MKKTEFQKYAYSVISKAFLELYMQGKVKKYSSEAKWDRQKIKYEPAYQRSVAIYFYRSGAIHIYQRGDFDQQAESHYYEWQESSDYQDVAAALAKDIAAFIERLNTPLGDDDFSEYWGHDGFCDFAYETSPFRTSSDTSGK
jgi:hypothetical protein